MKKQLGLSWEETTTAACLQLLEPSGGPRDRGSPRGMCCCSHSPGLWQGSSSPAPTPALRSRASDPRVMHGNEQDGGEQGGTATEQLQLHRYCHVLQKSNNRKKRAPNNAEDKPEGEAVAHPNASGSVALPSAVDQEKQSSHQLSKGTQPARQHPAHKPAAHTNVLVGFIVLSFSALIENSGYRVASQGWLLR